MHNKQHLRIELIHKRLKNKEKLTWEQIAQACEDLWGKENRPTKRTLQGDIQLLKQKGAPIPKRCVDGKWHYTKDFNLGENPLISDDIMLLQQIKNIVDQFPELSISGQFNGVIEKVEQSLQQDNSFTPSSIQFEPPKHNIETTHLSRLHKAISAQEVLEIHYQPFNKAKRIDYVHPYFLQQYNYRWFLIGWREDARENRVYGLERIKRIHLKPQASYFQQEKLDPNHYFDDVVGVTIYKDAPLEEVRIYLHPDRKPYVLSKKLHHSQELIKKNDDGSAIIRLKVKPNFELRALLLSHGKGLQVLSPPSLVQALKEEIDAMRQAYE